MKLGISEILKLAAKEKTIEERVAVLRKYDNDCLRILVRMSKDKDLQWELPITEDPLTDPPYKPLPSTANEHGRLYMEYKKLYLFMKGGNPNLKQTKREYLFIQLLESIDPEDAKLLLAVVRKQLPYKEINTRVINAAWPDLLKGLVYSNA